MPKCHSCATQLTITVADAIAKYIQEKVQTVIGILESSKAFDTVPHQRLIEKLKAYRIYIIIFFYMGFDYFHVLNGHKYTHESEKP